MESLHESMLARSLGVWATVANPLRLFLLKGKIAARVADNFALLVAMWHHFGDMAKASPSSQAEARDDLVADSLDRLADELQLVRSMLDEIRTDFQ